MLKKLHPDLHQGESSELPLRSFVLTTHPTRRAHTMSAVEIKDLWFSYEVAQSTSSTAKTIDASVESAKKAAAKPLMDGGLSIANPRQQHALRENEELVYKVRCARRASPWPKLVLMASCSLSCVRSSSSRVSTCRYPLARAACWLVPTALARPHSCRSSAVSTW